MMRAGRFVIVLLACTACTSSNAVHTLATATRHTVNGIEFVTSPGPTAWRDTLGWKLVVASRVQPAEGQPGELVAPHGIAVGDDGTLYVSDTKPVAIKVYAPDGHYVRTIGREGNGPGEYRAALMSVRHGFVYVQDPTNARVSRFDTSGTFINSAHSTCCMFAPPTIDTAGRFYIRSAFMQQHASPTESPDAQAITYLRFNSDLGHIDTVSIPARRDGGKPWQLKKGTSSWMIGVPFQPTTVEGLDPTGGFVVGWSGAYSLVLTRTGRDSVRVVQRAWTPSTITSAEREAAVEEQVKMMGDQLPQAELRDAFKVADVPTTRPVFDAIDITPDGTMWVELTSSAAIPHERFDVFDSTGAWLGEVRAPGSVGTYGRVFRRDEIVSVIDGEDGRPMVVRYRIDRGGVK